MGLAQLGVGARAVDEDLDAVHAHVDVRAARVPQLLADLVPDARVDGGHDGVAEGHLARNEMGRTF